MQDGHGDCRTTVVAGTKAAGDGDSRTALVTEAKVAGGGDCRMEVVAGQRWLQERSLQGMVIAGRW